MRRAPSSTARPTGTERTRPPSTKCSPSGELRRVRHGLTDPLLTVRSRIPRVARRAESGTMGNRSFRSPGHLGPVVVGRDVGDAVLAGLQPVPVEVRNRDVGAEVPSDLLVAFEDGDVDGHVVLAERDVVERLAIHVDDERVPHLLGRFAGEILQHPGAVDGHVARRATQDVEDGGWRCRDRPGHFDAISQEDGVWHVGLLADVGSPTTVEVVDRTSIAHHPGVSPAKVANQMHLDPIDFRYARRKGNKWRFGRWRSRKSRSLVTTTRSSPSAYRARA